MLCTAIYIIVHLYTCLHARMWERPLKRKFPNLNLPFLVSYVLQVVYFIRRTVQAYVYTTAYTLHGAFQLIVVLGNFFCTTFTFRNANRTTEETHPSSIVVRRKNQHRLCNAIICFRDRFARRILGYRARTRMSYTMRIINGSNRLAKRPLRMYVRRP